MTPFDVNYIVWMNAVINRDTNNLVSAALELFRNGGASVTTNGIAAYLPRVLPFSHNGFGQDAEWVTANFTNATKILAVGYPQWVGAQVGEGLTNGLFKLSVTVVRRASTSDATVSTTFSSARGFSSSRAGCSAAARRSRSHRSFRRRRRWMQGRENQARFF